jgi:hypothetical protein
MMHEECEKQNNRQRNADHPQKCAFAETHNRLLLSAMEEIRLDGKLVPEIFSLLAFMQKFSGSATRERANQRFHPAYGGRAFRAFVTAMRSNLP